MDALGLDDLRAAIGPLLPPDPLKPKGGGSPTVCGSRRAGGHHPCAAHRHAVEARAMPGAGLQRQDLLAAAGGMARVGRVGGAAPRTAGTTAGRRCAGSVAGGTGQLKRVREKEGKATRPNPTGRKKAGTKRHIIVDARGMRPGVMLSGANRHNSMVLAATLDAVPGMRTGRRGQPRHRPDKLHADKAYDHRRCRRECRARGIKARIARRGVETSQRLGRHRWAVERTMAWLARFRRLVVRYERRADLHLVLTTLACAPICRKQAQRFCP